MCVYTYITALLVSMQCMGGNPLKRIDACGNWSIYIYTHTVQLFTCESCKFSQLFAIALLPHIFAFITLLHYKQTKPFCCFTPTCLLLHCFSFAYRDCYLTSLNSWQRKHIYISRNLSADFQILDMTTEDENQHFKIIRICVFMVLFYHAQGSNANTKQNLISLDYLLLIIVFVGLYASPVSQH